MNEHTANELVVLHKSIARSARWFYWIAVLSIINALLMLKGMDWGAIFGLGATFNIESVILEVTTKAAVTALPFNFFIAGVYTLLGYTASRRVTWAFYIGTILYGVDMLLIMGAEYWIGVPFHVWALLSVHDGIKADTAARQIEAQAPVQPA